MTLTSRLVFAATVVLLLAVRTNGAPSLYEGFDYAAGDKIIGKTNPGNGRLWNDPSAPAQDFALDTHVIAAGSLSHPGLRAATGNSLVIPRDPQSNISKIGFPTYFYNSTIYDGNAPDGVFFSFAAKLQNWASTTDASAANQQNGAFFAGLHWNTDGGSFLTGGLYAAQIRIRRELDENGVQTGKFQLGVIKNNMAVDGVVRYAWDTKHSYSVGEELLLVGSYKFNSDENTTDDEAFLWVNPTPGAAAPAPTVTAPTGFGTYDVRSGTFYNVKSFYFRSDSVTPGTLLVDELRVGNSFADVTPAPEPTMLAAVAVAFVAGSVRRRRSY